MFVNFWNFNSYKIIKYSLSILLLFWTNLLDNTNIIFHKLILSLVFINQYFHNGYQRLKNTIFSKIKLPHLKHMIYNNINSYWFKFILVIKKSKWEGGSLTKAPQASPIYFCLKLPMFVYLALTNAFARLLLNFILVELIVL